MKKVLTIISIFLASQTIGQQIFVDGQSATRKFIGIEPQFNFFRDWSTQAEFKSGIGETVDLFPILFSVPGKKVELTGLQLDAEVKPQQTTTYVYRNSGSVVNLNNKDFIKRTVFIDKVDVGRMISYIERDIIPNLKTTFKKKSKEYVFKSNELFTSKQNTVFRNTKFIGFYWSS